MVLSTINLTAATTVATAGDLLGEIDGAVVGSAGTPKLWEWATVPLHEHARVINPLPYVVHTSSFNPSTREHNLPLADSVIILNDSVSKLNLPMPVYDGRQKSSHLSYIDLAGNFHGIRDGGIQGNPELGERQVRNWASAPRLFNSIRAGDSSWEITVTVIQDEAGSRTVTWQQYSGTTSSPAGKALRPQPSAPGPTARYATTYTFKWLGLFVGWICTCVSAPHQPYMTPVDSAGTKYIRAFILGANSPSLNLGLTTHVMRIPESVRKWMYDRGAWLNPSTVGIGSAGIVGSALLDDNTTVGYTGTPGGQSAGKEGWFNQTVVNPNDPVAIHEYMHVLDRIMYLEGAYPDGKVCSFPPGTWFFPGGETVSFVTTTSRRVFSLSEDVAMQDFMKRAYAIAISTGWTGRNSYNTTNFGLTGTQVIEWLPAAVGGFLHAYGDYVAGIAQMTCAVPPSMLQEVIDWLYDNLFGPSALNLVSAKPANSGLLSFAPPALSSPTTITLSNSNRKATMDPNLDYIVVLSGDIDVDSGIELNGGRNVRLIGGKINFTADRTLVAGSYSITGNVCTIVRAAHGFTNTTKTYAKFTSGGVSNLTAENPTITVVNANTYTFPYVAANTSGTVNVRSNQDLGSTQRGLYIKGNSAQTVARTVHVEGLWFAGPYLWEGINIDAQSEPGLTVQLQNIRFDQINTHLTATGHEGGDAVQAWNGPFQLKVDRLSVANAGYQGIFLQPFQFGSGPVGTYTFKNINLNGSSYVSPSGTGVGTNTSAYLYWHSNPTTVPLVLSNIYIQKNPSKAFPNGVIWPQDNNATWGAIEGSPPLGDFAPAALWSAGYVSPGYV